MTNDSFGPGPVNEWDDLDSFGLRFSLPFRGGRILAAVSGLTDRTDAVSDANRIDEASVGAAFAVISRQPLWASLAAGIDAVGNFGGLSVQRTSHAATGVTSPREVPTEYSGGFALAPLAGFKLLVDGEASFGPYLVIAGRASTPARGSLLAVAGLRYRKPGAQLAVGGGWRAVGGISPCATISALDAAENGPYLGFALRVGLLDLAFEDIPLLKKTNGSLGFVIGESAREPPDARSISLDLGLLVGSSVAQDVRVSTVLAGSPKDLHADAFLSFSGGWFPSNHFYGTDTLFWEYSAGCALILPMLQGSLRVSFGLSPFLSFEQLSWTALIRSTPLANRILLGLAPESGVRVELPGTSIPLGLGLRIRWRALQLPVEQAGDPFTERARFDLELFVFSDD